MNPEQIKKLSDTIHFLEELSASIDLSRKKSSSSSQTFFSSSDSWQTKVQNKEAIDACLLVLLNLKYKNHQSDDVKTVEKKK